MKKIKVALMNKDFQKFLVSCTIFFIGGAFTFRSLSTIDMKYGAKAIIQVAEEMQPGFKNALDAFIKSKYGLNAN